MKKETIEENKLIAIFMGYECFNPKSWCIVLDKNTTTGINTWAKYNSSWDWLMPVVEKIESLGFRVEIIGLTCSIYTNSEENIYVDEPAMTKTEATWQAVVEFIKWYNSQTHNP